MANEKFPIFFTVPSGDGSLIEINDVTFNSTGLEIKQKIAAIKGFPVESQTLAFSGSIFEDKQTLEQLWKNTHNSAVEIKKISGGIIFKLLIKKQARHLMSSDTQSQLLTGRQATFGSSQTSTKATKAEPKEDQPKQEDKKGDSHRM